MDKLNSSETNVDILIVGGGLVGSAMAVLLASQPQLADKSIAVIEPVPFKPNYSDDHYDPRVVALTENSRQLLERLGVWPSIAASRCCSYSTMLVKDGQGTGAVDFDAADIGRLNLGHIVENSVIVEQLLLRMEQLPNIRFLCPEKVQNLELCQDSATGEQVYRVGLESEKSLIASLVIAADGARSKVRELLGFETREWPYQQHALVTTIETEQPHQFAARQWFLPSGPLAFLPLQGVEESGEQACSIVWSQDEAEAERLMALDDNDFCEALSRASEGELGQVTGVDRRFMIPLHQRHATDYTKPCLALIGDAAHSIHPLAGQGVNLGFQDVDVLGEEIVRTLGRKLPLNSDQLLQRYQRRRKAENLRMMAVMEGFKRLFGSDIPPLRVLRNFGMHQFNHIAPLKDAVIKEVMGIR